MPLTLEQYATEYLPTRNLPWPTAPTIDPPKARPHLEPLPVKAVFWTVYGTLLAIPGGELRYEHEHEFVTDNALDKTIQEFKMWNSMPRKPGAPSALLKDMFRRALTNLQMTGGGGEKFPEVQAERVWDDILKKLQQKEYAHDAALLGPPAELVRKMAYFYHASIQGSGAYPGAADTLRELAGRGVVQGLLADGQTFTPAQLLKGLREQDGGFDLPATFPLPLRLISAEKKAKKPSETLFRAAAEAAAGRGLKPAQVLHVGSSLPRDIAPAKKLGFRTALFAGDKHSLSATGEQMKDSAFRPDVLMTELPQILDIVAG